MKPNEVGVANLLLINHIHNARPRFWGTKTIGLFKRLPKRLMMEIGLYSHCDALAHSSKHSFTLLISTISQTPKYQGKQWVISVEFQWRQCF